MKGTTVERLHLGPTSRVNVRYGPELSFDFLDHGRRWEVRIGGPFEYQRADGWTGREAGHRPEALALIGDSFGSIASVVVTSDGTLTMVAEDGALVRVPAEDDAETWVVRSHDGYVLPSPMR